MYSSEKIWTAAQFPRLHDLKQRYGIPQTVVEEAERVIKILDFCYGAGRDVDSEDGGYVLLMLPDSTGGLKSAYLDMLRQHCLCPNRAETETILCVDNLMEWHADLYLSTNEYGITVIYPLGKISD